MSIIPGVGILANLFGLGQAVHDLEVAPTFAVDATSVDPAVFGLASYTAPVTPAARIDRRTAIQVPGVKRARDLVCGTLGGLPLDLIASDRTAATSTLFDQPEKSVPRSVTMVRLFEDLFFEGIAWWRIVEFGWHNYPTKVRRLAPREVTVDEDTGKVWVNGVHVPDEQLVRFDSPSDGLLIAGARAIRTCLSLDAAAANAADGTPPVDYFVPDEDSDPLTDEEVKDLLSAWTEARREGRTAYVPAALKYLTAGWNPDQLQLADQRQHAVLEIARLAGVDPEDLGVSTTSRTYANAETRRRDLLDFTLAAYMQAVSDRLSMNDITPRGYYARFNLDAFLRSDTKTRYEAYQIGLQVGAITKPEVRELEDRPALDPADLEPAPQPHSPQENPVNASRSLRSVNFDTGPELRLDAPGATTFSVDTERRTITGLALPYGVVANSGGKRWQFSRGTLRYADVKRVKLWIGHDQAQAVGVATAFEDTDTGLVATFKVARGPEGDRALQLAEDGVLDGLSVGLGIGGKFTLRDGVHHAVEAPLMEVSLTPAPAFDDARVHSVAASAAHHHRGETVETTTETTEGPQDFSAITDAIAQGFAGLRTDLDTLRNPQQLPERETVAATGFEVNQPSPYRFDGTRGERSLTEDIRSAIFSNDAEAQQVLTEVMAEAFAVTTTNTGTLNPTQNRPDLYVPNLTYTRPLWELVSTGTINDKTPFTIPKFSAASGLVDDHVEGTEPTPGAFSASSQTVTPGALSGKIEVNREVLDQGGSPQADAIIWAEFMNAWYEAIEAKIATLLATTATTELNLAGGTDDTLVDALTAYFAGLQFVRGGNRFTAFAADGQLFPKLIAAKDSTNRALLPIVGPQNAQGQASGGFDRVQLGNQTIRAAWALGSAVDSQSYSFVPSSVWYWASAPKRFTFEYQVKSIDLAIWGYSAGAILRDSDVKPIDYTTADA